jgi:formylglycine-generating enzyme required for sulfatase activity
MYPRLFCVMITSMSLLCAVSAAQPAPKPVEGDRFTETIPDTLVKFEMIRVPGGKVEVMVDGKRQEVEVKPLFVARTELTWNAYDVFLLRLDLPEEQRAESADAESRPSKPYGAPDRGYGHHNYPVISITHHAAEKFCEWLSEKTGRKYRLPTEAEWEHACRGGGDGHDGDIDDVAWHEDNADDKTHPIGKKKPNAYGLHDMLGNVGEWANAMDGTPVLCGGTFLDPPDEISCATRAVQDDSWNMTDPQTPKSTWWLSDGPMVGFRIVCEE